jgi:DNA-binding CsgD family transcriptional regulator
LRAVAVESRSRKADTALIVGRASESRVLGGVLDAARSGRSSAMLVLGEPGIGKTALLESTMSSASDFLTVTSMGVESEMELPYAALQHLCRPILDRLSVLPDPQRRALSVAFGMEIGPAPEHLIVGLATLSLLAEVAQERPVLCVVDDAHWLDSASARALAFVARRRLSDAVAMVFASREEAPDLAGLPELHVKGLNSEDSRTLLATVVTGPLNDKVLDRVLEETQGNPLAIMELPHGLTDAQPAVGLRISAELPLSRRIEESYRQRIAELPQDTQEFMLIASAEAFGDAALVRRAAQDVGLPEDAALLAVQAGLLAINSHVRFRHPLVRSAVYRSAAPHKLRSVHSALANAIDSDLDPDRRAWHRGLATTNADEEVATELENSAGRAQQRGGLVAAAAFLHRAAELTSDRHLQAARLLFAAYLQLEAGRIDPAEYVLAESMRNLDDPALRAQAIRIDGAIRFAKGRGAETPGLLYDAALKLSDIDVSSARDILMEAIEAAMWAGRLTTGTTLNDVAQAARRLPGVEEDESIGNLLLTGYTARLTDSYANAVPWWRLAADLHLKRAAEQPRSLRSGMVWNATAELLDFQAHHRTARDWVRVARDQGAMATLPVALSGLAWCEALAGRIDNAEALYAEARDITQATGTPPVPGVTEILKMGVLCLRGQEEQARRWAENVAADAIARGQGFGVMLSDYGLTLLELSLGRYEEARMHALTVFEQDPLGYGTYCLADVVEAAHRSGDEVGARAALNRLESRALASDTGWGLGLLSRARALLADDTAANAVYQESLAHLEFSGVATDLARTHLLYGEWLRRMRRRRDARIQLRTAHNMFQAIGAEAFAARAGAELLASGEHARPRGRPTRVQQLTPQEQQVAQLAAEGDSNADIAAKLFISSHTVSYHLRKVFRKLSIHSRNQLVRALADSLMPN